ncbi:hypothetical protein ABG067_005730 [Albugo candida]
MAASVLLYSAGQNPVLGVGGQKNRSIGKNSEGYQELDAIIQNDDRGKADWQLVITALVIFHVIQTKLATFSYSHFSPLSLK